MYSRRRFIQHSSAAFVTAAAASVLPGSLSARTRPVPPSDRVRVALIGTAGMGFTDLRTHVGFPEVDAVALCDVDRNVLETRATELEQLTKKKPELYGDFRRVLDRKDIYAVIIATPDHWHPYIMISACQAGKDVYCEKPLANSIEECDHMAAAAKKYNRIVQVGQWQRSGPHWQEAMEYVWSGKLGEIRTVKAWAYQGWMKNIPALPDAPVPAGVDYDMWLGPAPKRPFNPNRFHFNFRWFWDYAGGLMTDWGVHMIDMVLWGMKATAPVSVTAIGGKLGNPAGGEETPDTLQAIYDFNGWTMLWEHAQGINGGPYGRDHGVAFIGNNGTLVADRGKWEVIPEVQDGKARGERVEPKTGGQTDLFRHTRNFLDCIKSREQPACNPDVARGAALNAHLGNVAYKTGRRVNWEDSRRQFKDDAEANNIIKAKAREPWKLPTV